MYWGVVIQSDSMIHFAPQMPYRHLVDSRWSLHNNSLLFSDGLVLCPIRVGRMVMGTSAQAITAMTCIHSSMRAWAFWSFLSTGPKLRFWPQWIGPNKAWLFSLTCLAIKTPPCLSIKTRVGWVGKQIIQNYKTLSSTVLDQESGPVDEDVVGPTWDKR